MKYILLISFFFSIGSADISSKITEYCTTKAEIFKNSKRLYEHEFNRCSQELKKKNLSIKKIDEKMKDDKIRNEKAKKLKEKNKKIFAKKILGKWQNKHDKYLSKRKPKSCTNN